MYLVGKHEAEPNKFEFTKNNWETDDDQEDDADQIVCFDSIENPASVWNTNLPNPLNNLYQQV